VQSYKDSVLNDTRKTGPQYQPYDSTQLSEEAKIFKGVKAGDSLVFEVEADSAFKKSKPKFKVRGGKLITRVRVLKIFENADSARADLERSRRY
jgi:hypothetical protein